MIFNSSRFIINVPDEERSDMIRLFFQIELAHWFYLDFYCDTSFSNMSSSSSSGGSSGSSSSSSGSSSSSDTASSEDSSDDEDESFENLVRLHPTSEKELSKPCSIKVFAENIFRYCPFLMQHSNQVDNILTKWKEFKHALPTNGAIMLDESMKHVLLVQGFWAKASWGFPKGKVIEDETEAQCAIREVLEETGYDISEKLSEQDHLRVKINDQIITLYIITNVPKTTKFEPKTRREIKEVRWFRIDELPVHRKDLRCKEISGFSPNSFFMVIPFVKALKKWISHKHKSSGHFNTNGHNKSNRSHSTYNHKRTNSISHYTISKMNHHNHHHHHHIQHNHSLNHYSYNNNNNNGSFMNKAISKSNENLNNSNNNSPNNRKTPKNMKQLYQKMQYNEFADFLNIKEAALANKSSNKLTSSTSNNQLLGSSASKFKPIKSNKFNYNNNNSSSGQYQSLSHQSNENRSSNLNKSLSKSNENLSFQSPFNRKTPNGKHQQQQQQQQSIRYNSNNNPFLKHFSKNENHNMDSEKFKQQSQFIQKMQLNEVADLLSLKESALANKSNNNNNHQSTANKFISQNHYGNQQQSSTPNTTKFKPINNNSAKVS